MNDSSTGCGHVFIGQAEQTIVKMPSNCGKGPYARIVELDIHPNQSALLPQHDAMKPPSEPVYLLHFDYNFVEIVCYSSLSFFGRGVQLINFPAAGIKWACVHESRPIQQNWLLSSDQILC